MRASVLLRLFSTFFGHMIDRGFVHSSGLKLLLSGKTQKSIKILPEAP